MGDCLPTAAYPVPQSVTERENSIWSLDTEPGQIAESVRIRIALFDLADLVQIYRVLHAGVEEESARLSLQKMSSVLQ